MPGDTHTGKDLEYIKDMILQPLADENRIDTERSEVS